MAGTRKSVRKTNKTPTSNNSSPKSKVTKSKVTKSKAAPKSQGPTSKSDANGGAIRSENGFYNDEEAWIEICYTLLADAQSKIADFRPPPMTEILLCYNAFFQGYKEPIGDDTQHAHAVAVRPRKSYADFNNYVTNSFGYILEQFEGIETIDYEVNQDNLYRPEITPELLQNVQIGKTSIADLAWEEARPDDRPWIEKATTRLQGREEQFHFTGLESNRHSDQHLYTQSKPHAQKIWDPEGIIQTSHGKSYQMVNRHADAAVASALLFAAAVPPLGFCGDLRTLSNEDFDGEAVQRARAEMLTDEERRLQTPQQEREWVEQERRNHEANVAVLAARAGPAARVYRRLEEDHDREVLAGRGGEPMDVDSVSAENSGGSVEMGGGGDTDVSMGGIDEDL